MARAEHSAISAKGYGLYVQDYMDYQPGAQTWDPDDSRPATGSRQGTATKLSDQEPNGLRV